MLFTNCAPAIARQGTESRRKWPGCHGLDLVVRPVGLACGRPRWFFDSMCAGVPPMTSEVDPATERELVVDHDDFLMVRAAERDAIVETELHAAGCAPPELPSREGIAFERVERRVVPDQDVAAQMGPPSRDEPQQVIESCGGVRHRRRVRLPWAPERK